MFRNHLLNKMQMFKTIFKSRSLSFDNIKMLLINFRKSKLKNTTTKCIFGEEKHQAMKGFVANFFFLLFKQSDHFGDEIFHRQEFWRYGIRDETNFIAKKQILSSQIIGDEIQNFW